MMIEPREREELRERIDLVEQSRRWMNRRRDREETDQKDGWRKSREMNGMDGRTDKGDSSPPLPLSLPPFIPWGREESTSEDDEQTLETSQESEKIRESKEGGEREREEDCSW